MLPPGNGPLNLLVVHPAPPAPEAGAADRCGVGLLRGLLANGMTVMGVAPVLPGTVAAAPGDLPVEAVAQTPARRGARARLSHLRRPLFELGSGELAAKVRELAPRFDAVHLDTAEMTWAADGVVAPTVLHMHYRARLDRSLSWPWRREARELALYVALERRALRRHRALVANSPVVADTIRREAPGVEVVQVPLTLDPSYYARAALNGPPVAGIIGTRSWPPTGRAMDHLAEVVWPAVRRQLPEARLRIAGRGTAGAAFAAVAADDLEVVGEVDSSAAFLRGLSVLAYPLNRGSGMKVKVLEALATGVPVVTTPCGAEGIVPNDGVVVVSNDDEMVAALTAVLADPIERQQRGEAALATFTSTYAPAVATAPLADLFRRLVGG